MFFYLRDLSFSLQDEKDAQLPLTKVEECVKLGDVLDLSESFDRLISLYNPKYKMHHVALWSLIF